MMVGGEEGILDMEMGKDNGRLMGGILRRRGMDESGWDKNDKMR